MAEDLLSVLTRFRQELMERIHDMVRSHQDLSERVGQLAEGTDAKLGSLRIEMLSGFDAIYKRFDRLESEYAALKPASSVSSSAWTALKSGCRR